MSAPRFPPAMQEWVTRNFSLMQKMPPATKEAATEEMKKIIAHAYSTNSMLTTHWPSVQLASLNDPNPLNSLKRKLPDHAPGPNKKVQVVTAKASAQVVKPLKTNVFEDDARAKREKRFQREALIEQNRQAGPSQHNYSVSGGSSGGALGARMHGFAHHTPWGHVQEPEPVPDANVIDWDKHTIVGRSSSIFKNYLRLTSDPDPKDIRPLPVLKQTLEQLKQRWRSEGNYHWVCDQFKSLRQDLTVQRIKNDFTVLVYEIHARIALENSDLVEFNACQATLKQLYELGLNGKREEFLAYRILYMLHGRNKAGMSSTSKWTDKALPAVQHAMKAHMAMATVKMLLNELGYEPDELQKLLDFLTAHSANVFTNPNAPDVEKQVACAAVHNSLVQVQSQKYAKVGIRGSI
ncbi:related to MNI2-Protein of unknown function localised to nucleus [Serendipita indica DSM 11827]|uniref:SAC3/GANP/THP3 conserved domain-containing protein n=1 Tax=Serendipita indica (strain DSM 11827) TaxID=1109443 RepID=G4TJ62_SERID|nr:related to MNI2-Protein of unknown function localised to nucleus [Serendipita indica DSM 11827]